MRIACWLPEGTNIFMYVYICVYIYISVHVQFPLFLSDFKEILFFDRFTKNPQILNLLKISPAAAQLLHADGRTDG
jgi:hypothetical protein